MQDDAYGSPAAHESRRHDRMSASHGRRRPTTGCRPGTAAVAPRKIAMATIGRNSPTAPAAMMYLPKPPRACRCPAGSGSRVPESGRGQADGHGHEGMDEADGREQRRSPRPPAPPSPPRDQREPPTFAEQLQIQLVAGEQEEEPQSDVGEAARCSADPPSPRTWGPIRMPPTISTTTWGTRLPGSTATTNGASADTRVTTTKSVDALGEIAHESPGPPGGGRHRDHLDSGPASFLRDATGSTGAPISRRRNTK